MLNTTEDLGDSKILFQKGFSSRAPPSLISPWSLYFSSACHPMRREGKLEQQSLGGTGSSLIVDREEVQVLALEKQRENSAYSSLCVLLSQAPSFLHLTHHSCPWQMRI